MVAFATAVAAVFGITGRGSLGTRFKHGCKIFLEFVGVGLALAWILYLLP
jgi:hypothetical protein